MAIRKIDLMHRTFGMDPAHICGECHNLVEYSYHDKLYRKCKVYGLTSSAATDWAKRYIACGRFNQEHNGREIVWLVRATKRQEAQKNCVLSGQMSFLED